MKAPSRIVIALNPRCSECDNSPLCEKIRRPKIRSERERDVMRHIFEREITFRRNCPRLSKDMGGLGKISGFGVNGSSASSDGGVLRESGRNRNILKRGDYMIEGGIESARVRGFGKEDLEIQSLRILRVVYSNLAI